MGMIEDLCQRIKEEIENDPMKRGYAGKSEEEIVALMNAPFTTIETVEVQHEPRVMTVVNAIPYAQNTIKKEDVKETVTKLGVTGVVSAIEEKG